MAREWDEIDCPKCKNAINAKALICLHCRTEFTAAEAYERAKKHTRNLTLGWLGLLFIGVTLWFAFTGDDDSGEVVEKQVAPTAREVPKESATVKSQETTEELAQRLSANASRNAWSKKLFEMSEEDRAYSLAKVAGCTSTGRSMWMGSDGAGVDSWSVGCREGDNMVTIAAEGDGKTQILECSLLPLVKLECWKTFDAMNSGT